MDDEVQSGDGGSQPSSGDSLADEMLASMDQESGPADPEAELEAEFGDGEEGSEQVDEDTESPENADDEAEESEEESEDDESEEENKTETVPMHAFKKRIGRLKAREKEALARVAKAEHALVEHREAIRLLYEENQLFKAQLKEAELLDLEQHELRQELARRKAQENAKKASAMKAQEQYLQHRQTEIYEEIMEISDDPDFDLVEPIDLAVALRQSDEKNVKKLARQIQKTRQAKIDAKIAKSSAKKHKNVPRPSRTQQAPPSVLGDSVDDMLKFMESVGSEG